MNQIIYIALFISSCTTAQEKPVKKQEDTPVITRYQFCNICNYEGKRSALKKYYQLTNLNDRYVSKIEITEIHLRRILMFWMMGNDDAKKIIAQQYKGEYLSTSDYGKADKIIRDIQKGVIEPEFLRRVDPDLIIVGEDLRHLNFQYQKINELLHRINAAEDNIHGKCGLCYRKIPNVNHKFKRRDPFDGHRDITT